MPRQSLTARLARAARHRADVGSYGPRRRGNRASTLWNDGEFVAVDGEGFSDGDEFRIFVGARHSRYSGRGHNYALIAASDNSSLYNPAGRLSGLSCLSFLCRIVENNPRAILVAFGATYDVMHICGRDLSAVEIKQLIGKDARGRRLYLSDDRYSYGLEYCPRKCLTIRRWNLGEQHWTRDKSGKLKATPHLTVNLWDVWGFFQGSFVEAMRKWLPGDPDYEMIKREKGNRAIFDRSEIDAIVKYNQAELRCLVKIMDKARDAICDLGLTLRRWDGAGAVAKAMLAQHRVKDHIAELPPEVFEAARRAYSGGHIEACKVGHHDGKVHHYDINSAYPDQFRRLPSLTNRKWRHGHGLPPPLSLVKLSFRFTHDRPFYPLFYRCEDGGIIYPRTGTGWYHASEYETARDFAALYGADEFRVIEWWALEPETPDHVLSPFTWVEDAYTKRQMYIENAKRAGTENGPEKIIKLGLNSLYGATCQQVGARIVDGELRTPPYFQLFWAGMVTAGCRAKMMRAAMQTPSAIVCFATDGLFSTEPLDLDCPDQKILGAWEHQTHDGMTIVAPGVYWLHDGPKVTNYSRGFDKAAMSAPDHVIAAWRAGQADMAVETRKLIGLGTAASSKSLLPILGCFVTVGRSLKIDGSNSKRYGINVRRDKPHRQLVATYPVTHAAENYIDVPESAPYKIAWLDGATFRDEEEVMEIQDALDAELA